MSIGIIDEAVEKSIPLNTAEVKHQLSESTISVISHKQSIKGNSDESKNAPNDTFYLCYVYFFFMGFMSTMPVLFIGTAANYWMFKFRDVNSTSDDASNRTSLQSLYQSSSMVASALPSVVFTLLTTLFGKKFDAEKMNLGALTALFTIFFTFTVFTRIDTDSWQVVFFAITMLLQGLLSSSLGIYSIFSMVIIAKFPHKYMRLYLLGQSGGILTDVLQVVSISVTRSDSDGALIYFLTGTTLIAVSVCWSFGIRFTKTHAFYSKNYSNDYGKEERITWSETKEIARLIWPLLCIALVMVLTSSTIHPSISSLVASKHHADGGDWEKKYFTPVIAFMLADVSCLVGKILSRGQISKSNFPFWMTGCITRTIVVIGVIMFCNAQPRHHLPVVFHEDWIFIVWTLCYHSSVGFIMNVVFLSVHDLSEGKSEAGLKLLSVVLTVATAMFSANGIAVVKIL